MRAAALVVLLAAPLRAAKPAPASPTPSASLAFYLSGAVGADGLEVLARRGYVVLQGPKNARRAAAVHWKALERLSGAARSCWALAASVDAAVSTGAARGGDWGPCRALPVSGAVTPAVRAMAASLAALREETAALAADGDSAPIPPAASNLFAKPWGRELAERAHADLLEDPGPLLRPFFDEQLAGPRPGVEAWRHFVAAAEHGAPGLDARISSDAARGAPSEELKAQLRRYFSVERRRWNAQSALAELSRLRKASGLELTELVSVTAPLSARPGLLEKAEASVSGAGVGEAPRLRSAGLHLQEPAKLGQYELGDEILFSGAYWVDGLPEGRSAEFEESTFGESADGFFAVETRRVRRENGGPYPYRRRLRVDAPGSFVARAAVTSESGSEVSERVEVKVAPDFELALAKEAQAAARRQACAFKDAEAAYVSLEALVAEPAKAKPQYKALLSRAAKSRSDAVREGARLAELDGLLDKARAASSPESCRYETGPAEAALKLVEGLPAGCDGARPELLKLRAMSSRRAADHAWFLKASADARSKRKACDLEGAAARWTGALAVLEADPAARCGKAAEESELAAKELAETRRELAWVGEFSRALERGEAKTPPEERLESARFVSARLPVLSSAKCHAKLAARAAALSQGAAAELAPPSPGELARRLSPDPMLAALSAEVRRERARLAAAAELAARASAESQSPAPAATKAPAAPPAAVEDAPPAKRPAPAPRPAPKAPAKKTARPGGPS